MTFKNDEAVLEFKNLYQNQEEDENRKNILLYSFILSVADEAEKEPNLTFEKFAEIFYKLHACVNTQAANILKDLPKIMEIFRKCWLYGCIIPKIGA